MQSNNDAIERIRTEANLVDIVSEYLRLKRTGKNWLGLCPFHDDKKPSFTVEPVRGIYKCFSCGKGGNVFTFLMEKNGWTFPETLRFLADRYGIPLEENRQKNDQISNNEILTNLLLEASKYYTQNLNDKKNIIAQNYVLKRGFSQETVKKFGIGYSIDSWNSLITELQKIGAKLEDLDKAGLVVKNESRGLYDRFRGRIMFSIHSATGKILGFGARRLTEDETQPKYINSPESPVYHKSKLLYGLFQAKDSIRKKNQAIIVEGYVDVISLHQNGVTNAVATCGTALAIDHAELLSRYTQSVVLVFDSDVAGENATIKAINVLLNKGLEVLILRLPQGEDPDTFIRKFGNKEFERKISMQAITFVDFLTNFHKINGSFNSPEKQANAIREIVASIALITDQLKRELYTRKFISTNSLDEKLVYKELNDARSELSLKKEQVKSIEPITKKNELDQSEALITNQVKVYEEIETEVKLNIGLLPSEEFLILKTISDGDPQIIEHVLNSISDEDFTHPIAKEMFSLVCGYYENQRSFSIDDVHLEELTRQIREFVAMLAVEPEQNSTFWKIINPDIKEPNSWQIIEDTINKFKINRLDKKIKLLQSRIQQAHIYSQNNNLESESANARIHEEDIDKDLLELHTISMQKQELVNKYV